MKTTGVTKEDLSETIADKMLDTKGAAELLSVSPACIRKWRERRVIPAYKIEGALRYSSAELMSWAKSRRA